MSKSKAHADEHSDEEALPGKNRNSFLVFQSEYRMKLKEKHPDMTHVDVQAKISEKWKSLDEPKKQARSTRTTTLSSPFFRSLLFSPLYFVSILSWLYQMTLAVRHLFFLFFLNFSLGRAFFLFDRV